jgi:CheY-like chemotaxis protein
MENMWHYNWAGKSILVVEDDHVNYSYLDALLKPTRAKVFHAGHGEAALEMLERNSFFNIILMDIRLPGISGLEAARKLLAKCGDLVIIAQTAYVDEWTVEQALEAGCVDFIAKPIAANDMLAMIRKYLGS